MRYRVIKKSWFSFIKNNLIFLIDTIRYDETHYLTSFTIILCSSVGLLLQGSPKLKIRYISTFENHLEWIVSTAMIDEFNI